MPRALCGWYTLHRGCFISWFPLCILKIYSRIALLPWFFPLRVFHVKLCAHCHLYSLVHLLFFASVLCIIFVLSRRSWNRFSSNWYQSVKCKDGRRCEWLSKNDGPKLTELHKLEDQNGRSSHCQKIGRTSSKRTDTHRGVGVRTEAFEQEGSGHH